MLAVTLTMCVHHLFYGNDSVLMAPSPSALQTLITICDVFAKENEIMFNTKTTACMAVLPKYMKDFNVPTIFINNRE